MRVELLIVCIAAFCIANTYYDGKYVKMFMVYKKYYKIIMIAFVAICAYTLFKRNPLQAKRMLLCTNNLIKYMPINRSTMNMITPIYDLSTDTGSFLSDMNQTLNPRMSYNPDLEYPQELKQYGQQQQQQGQTKNKRSVSETKKKYVASRQDWKCGECRRQLTHTFEIDHHIRLEHGGDNSPSNLVALCRECHGNKTAFENM